MLICDEFVRTIQNISCRMGVWFEWCEDGVNGVKMVWCEWCEWREIGPVTHGTFFG
jgi:hypothetical protein